MKGVALLEDERDTSFDQDKWSKSDEYGVDVGEAIPTMRYLYAFYISQGPELEADEANLSGDACCSARCNKI